MATTQLWPYGGPGSPYGSFAGKDASAGGSKTYTATFTRLGLHGSIALPYGNFAGKAPTPEPTIRGGGRLVERPRRDPRIAEDDELLLIIAQACAMSINTTRH
jgi:hypothetical protein